MKIDLADSYVTLCNSYISYVQSMTPNCHTFFHIEKFKISVTIWEHLPKRYYLCTIIKQNKKVKSVKIWGHGLYI